MLTNATGATVKVLVPVVAPDVAEITEDPSVKPVAMPVVVMLAIVGDAELKLAIAVMSLLLPSVYVPIAPNCCRLPI